MTRQGRAPLPRRARAARNRRVQHSQVDFNPMATSTGLRAWLRPWRVAIAVTAAFLGVSYLITRAVQNWYGSVIMVAVTSLWVAWDSARVRVRRYKTQMANEPMMMLFMCFTLWILVFPWYLIIRQGIRQGFVPLKEPGTS